MTFQNLPSVAEEAVQAFAEQLPLSELPCGAYARMRYPRFPALMHFTVKRYAAKGYGNVFTMDTRAMGGLMQLSTIVFTPNAGTNVPLLLIDVMAMGKKRAAFIEYYDCTGGRAADCPLLTEMAKRYANVPDYAEKSAWYVGERAPYSLIKGGTDEETLLAMLRDSAVAYAKTCATAGENTQANRDGLAAFVERMVQEGNPSSATMERVLGKDGAEAFFRMAVMPAVYTEQSL